MNVCMKPCLSRRTRMVRTAIAVLALLGSGMAAATTAAQAQEAASGKPPAATQVVPAGVLAIAGVDGSALYDEPRGTKIQDLAMAARLRAVMRSPAGDWVFVVTDDGVSGWAPAASLVAFALDTLPAVEAAADAVSDEKPQAAAPPSTAGNATGATPGMPATVTITEQRLNIRSGPGLAFGIVGKALPQEQLMAAARTADAKWVRIVQANLPTGSGWVAAEFITLANVDGLPIDASSTAAPGKSEPESVEPVNTAQRASTVPTAEIATSEEAQPTAPAGAQVIAAQPAELEGRIVFHDGRNNIYAYDLTSGDVNWLTNGFDPDVTRDGRRVVFIRAGGDANGVWTINADGSNAQLIHRGGEIMRSPKWSPNGEWIVFSHNSDTDKCYDLGPYFGCYSFSQLQAKFPHIPSSMLYDRLLEDADVVETANWGLTRVAAAGGDFRDLPVLDSALAPDWNEGGISYQARPGIEITEDTADGRTRPVIHQGWGWDPDWQPGSGQIVYQSKEGPHWELWSINADGSGLTALTHPRTTLVDRLPSNAAPAFSPDGRHIVYVSNRDDSENAGPWRLWVMDAGGGNQHRLPIDIEIDYDPGAQVASWGM